MAPLWEFSWTASIMGLFLFLARPRHLGKNMKKKILRLVFNVNLHGTFSQRNTVCKYNTWLDYTLNVLCYRKDNLNITPCIGIAESN